MTQAEKLEALVRKAVECGFVLPNESWDYKIQSDRVIILTSMAIGDDGYEEPGNWRVATFEIIFNHDFVKALWGVGEIVYRAEVFESPTPGESGFDEYYENWEYRLTQAVISEQPIDYMYEAVFGLDK